MSRRLAPRTVRNQSGFTLIELLVVVLIAGIVLVAILGLYLSLFRSSADQTARMENQDSARFAMYEISRFIRSACSSDANVTSSTSDSLALAGPQELVFFADIDNDGDAERVRYYLSGTTLRMQTAEPNTGVTPHTYPTGYSGDAVVILDGIRNGADAVFQYFGYDDDAVSLYEIPNPNTTALRLSVVAVSIRLLVNEKPELARGGVELSTQVQIRQRYDGGLGDS